MIYAGVSGHSGGGGGHGFDVPDSDGSGSGLGTGGFFDGLTVFFRSISVWWDSVLKKEDSRLKENWEKLHAELNPAGKFGFFVALVLVLFVGWKLAKKYLLKKILRWF